MRKFTAVLVFGIVVLGGMVGCSHAPRAEAPLPVYVSAIEVKGCTAIVFLKEIEKALFDENFYRRPVNAGEAVVDFPEPFELQEKYLAGSPAFITFVKNDYRRQSQSSNPYAEVGNEYRLSSCVQRDGMFYLMGFRNDLETGDRFWGERFEQALQKASKSTGCVLTMHEKRKWEFWSEALKDYYFKNAKRGFCRETLARGVN